MNVKQILKVKGDRIISQESGVSMSDVADTLSMHGIGAIPILDAGQLVGIVSERDIVRFIAEEGAEVLSRPVKTCMTCDVATCGVDDTVDEILTLMTKRRFRHLPVMEGDKMVGMISIGDVVKEKLNEAKMEADALKSYIATG